ncbi:MAG: 50S ribosomal protein L3 [Patescibacteria group bacterium]
MKFLVGTKQNMTQVWSDDGHAEPATLLAVLPGKITQLKTLEKDGYVAVQAGFGEKKEKKVNKAQKAKGLFAHYKEFRSETNEAPTVNVGDEIKAESFAPGDTVTVTGISKGRGFQGVVKRHGFHGGRRTHGQKHSEREPGSIGGAGRAGGRVVKGMRMGGRMGSDRVTVKNLRVLQVDAENGYILVSGAVPGRRGTLIEIIGQ